MSRPRRRSRVRSSAPTPTGRTFPAGSPTSPATFSSKLPAGGALTAAAAIKLQSPLRRRKLLARSALFLILVVIGSSVLDHLGVLGATGRDDWNRFDHQECVVTHVIDGDTIRV